MCKMAAEAVVLSHFGQLVGSPSFPGWLTKGLERRLQTIHCAQLRNLYRYSSFDSKSYELSTLPCYRVASIWRPRTSVRSLLPRADKSRWSWAKPRCRFRLTLIGMPVISKP
jgi:hypothetical protein